MTLSAKLALERTRPEMFTATWDLRRKTVEITERPFEDPAGLAPAGDDEL
jgi:hypothetical protein